MTSSENSIFIANRGEIAVRIITAARKLGIKTIQAYSSVDKDMLAVQMADEAIEIGPAPAQKSYLNVHNVIEAAKSTKASAIHPGYGFLAENATFAKSVVDAGMVFIGPSAEIISKMGDKITAKNTASAAGVPVIPGSNGRVRTVEDAVSLAQQIGFPQLIKASAGGGGKGIRSASNIDELKHLMPLAQAEASAAFGDDGIYLERVIRDARHVEVQILGDGQKVIHLYERECSLQRRRQKIWEEAPASCLDDKTRQEICLASVRLAEAVNYKGAGTIEYLYEPESNDFFFMEMNTRVQVEHPVTEAITGIDIIAEMIKIAFGEKLKINQNNIQICGHAIELRINAEDPYNSFMPSPGIVSAINIPENVRFDTLLYEGYNVLPFYDSLIGKLIVAGQNRDAVIGSLSSIFKKMSIRGIKTTLPLFKDLIEDSNIITGDYNTSYLENWLSKKQEKN
jgi:acetyl-CoA carboxylase biotin carboxylase subunit